MLRPGGAAFSWPTDDDSTRGWSLAYYCVIVQVLCHLATRGVSLITALLRKYRVILLSFYSCVIAQVFFLHFGF